LADEVLKTAEEEDFEASGLGNGGHRENCNPRAEMGLGAEASGVRSRRHVWRIRSRSSFRKIRRLDEGVRVA
jgi:hypothetical protein